MPSSSPVAKFYIPRTLVSSLLRLYDYPDPRAPGRVIRGYDKAHACRTAKMCGAVAAALGHPRPRVELYQIACILHDIGRAGLDRRLFGDIWSWAKERKIPTRPREWRARFPETRYGYETEAFLRLYGNGLKEAGIPVDAWTKEQIEMRLGYSRRLTRMLRVVRPALQVLQVPWHAWMGRVMLYYYYPEKLEGASHWVKQLAESLVACEQFEAFNNRRRGRDYYVRNRESLHDAFAYLRTLKREGMLSEVVVNTIKQLCAEGVFDRVVAEARGGNLSQGEVATLSGERKGRTPQWR